MSITILIVIVTAIISFMAFSNQQLVDKLIFYPPAITNQKQYYRFITCGFIHADWPHLIFNMFSLYMFGGEVEQAFSGIFGSSGRLLYLLMYLAALVVSLLPTYMKNKNNSHYMSLGASGAVSAVVFAGLLIAPYVEVGFYFIPPIIPGFIFGPLYLIFSYYLEKRSGDNINHSAHIWGALFGLAFVIIVGKVLANYDAIQNFIDGVKFYLSKKGWL